MFPLSDHASIIVLAASVYLVSAGFFALASRYRVLALVPLIGIVAWAYLVFQTDNRENSYEGMDSVGDIIAIVLYSAIVAASAIIVLIARRIAAKETGTNLWRLAAVLLVCFPASYFVGHAVTKQYVPDASCSNVGIPVHLGNTRLHIPVEFEPRLVVSTEASEQPEALYYKFVSNRKEDVSRLCRLTRNGRIAAPVLDILLTPSRINQALKEVCSKAGTNNPICVGHASNHYSDMLVIRLTTEFDGHWAHLRHNFNKKDDPGLHTGGDKSAGFVCRDAKPSKTKAHCYVWQSLGDDAMVLIETGYFAKKSVAELLANAESATAYSLWALAQNASE